MPKTPYPTPAERDEPIKLPTPPEDALRALLAVDPESEPVAEAGMDDGPGTEPSAGRRST